ncbi:MAG TPA: SCO family protein [Gammaproteobacteria bacterium]
MAVIWPAFLFIVLFAAWMLAQHYSQPALANAVLYPETSREIRPFRLIDHNNRVFDNQRLLGKWSFVFFGYTRCPDVCPLTLQTLGRVAELLEEPNNNVQFIFVSVDPARDSNIHLKNYVGYFDPDFVGVTGEESELVTFSKALGGVFGRDDEPGSGSYTVSHSAQLFLINPDAERYALLPHPHQAEVIIDDFYTIRSHYGEGA